LFTNSSFSGVVGDDNRTFIEETDFSIVPPDTIVYEGDLRENFIFKQGEAFPTESIRSRASVYLTNSYIYEKKLSPVFGQFLTNLHDYQQDYLTNMPILSLIPSLSDFTTITETWVSMMAKTLPRIEGNDFEKIGLLSEIISASNFDIAYRNAFRSSQILYGNAILMIQKTRGGNFSFVEINPKNWIPVMHPEDPTSIAINLIFNTFEKHGEKFVEFIAYHEDGFIEKFTFQHNGGILGDLLDYKEGWAFDDPDLGISPIVVFSGDSLNGSVYGLDKYRYWESAITACIMAFKNVMILDERLKEIHRIVPASATERDIRTGATYLPNKGVITFEATPEQPQAPDIKVVVPEVDRQLKAALDVYDMAVKRLSRDTGIIISLLNPDAISTGNLSSQTLRLLLLRTENAAQAFMTLMKKPLHELVSKVAKIAGIGLEPSEISLNFNYTIAQDPEVMTKMVQERVGRQQTMTLEDAIAILDNKPMHEAILTANKIRGIQNPESTSDVSLRDSGGKSEVSDINFTSVTTDPGVNKDAPSGGIKEQEFSLIGGMNLGTENKAPST